MTWQQYTSLGALVVVVLWETLWPARPVVGRWPRAAKNGGLACLNALVVGGFALSLHAWVFAWTAQQAFGLRPLLGRSPWVSGIVIIVLFDAWTYWVHRWHHRLPWLWRFHQVHHSDVEMDVSTAVRFHPGEIVSYSLMHTLAFAALGMSVELYAVYKVLFFANVLLHHSNVRIGATFDRWLRWLIVSPQMHRVHHSRAQAETNSNYSSGLSVWDRMFGSYREAPPASIVFGLARDREPQRQTVMALLKRPFVS